MTVPTAPPARQRGPAVWDPRLNAWVVRSYAMVDAVLADPHLDVVPEIATAPTVRRPDDRTPSVPEFFADWFSRSQRHRTVKRKLHRPFSERHLADVAAGFAELADEQIAGLGDRGDLLIEFLRPFALGSTVLILETPAQARDPLGRVSQVLSRTLNTPEPTAAQVRAVQKCIRYLHRLVTGLLADPAATGPLVTALRGLRDEPSGGVWLAVATFGQLLAAGFEPVAIGSALAVRELVARELVGAVRDGSLSALDVGEEALRLNPPFTFIQRWSVSPCRCLGVPIEPHSRVLVDLRAVHSDPEVYDQPAEFIPGRERRFNLTYGKGPHYCLGTASARLQVAAALSAFCALRPPVLVDPAAVQTVWAGDYELVSAVPYTRGDT